MSRYGQSPASLPVVDVERVGDDDPAPATPPSKRRLPLIPIVVVTLAIVATLVVLEQRRGPSECPTRLPEPFGAASPSRPYGDYTAASGTAVYPTADCRFRLPQRFAVAYHAEGGVFIVGSQEAYSLGFDLFAQEPAGGTGAARFSIIDPGTPGDSISSTFGLLLPRLPQFLDMPIGGTDAVPSVHGAFVLTIRHPTAIRWELTIQRTGLDAPAERESSLLSATLTLDVDTPSPPWQHIELRWDANEQHGDAHVRLLLDRAPEPTNATVIPTPTAGISAPPEPGPCPGSAQPPCGG